MSKKENKKIYEKALSLYNTGYIDKAIDLCEKGISRDLKNSNIINLKGLLLYLKGNLKEAIALWKINKDYNNDEISKTYLKDIEKDFIREEIYEETQQLISNLLIDEAIENLRECSKSDFNLINVNNSLAFCYLRKGEYENSLSVLERVFSVDKNNIKAKEIQKEISSILNLKDNNIKLIKIISLSLGSIALITCFNFTFKLIKENKNKIISENSLENVDKEKIESENQEKLDINKEEINKKQEVNEEKIELSNEEILENYEKGTDFFEKGKYKEAKEILEYTLKPSEGNHLNDDILFLLASTSELIGDKDGAIKYFEEFILKYNNGNYIEESYYKVTLLYKERDLQKSKYYANELMSKFPNSIYNNNNIKEIIAS